MRYESEKNHINALRESLKEKENKLIENNTRNQELIEIKERELRYLKNQIRSTSEQIEEIQKQRDQLIIMSHIFS